MSSDRVDDLAQAAVHLLDADDIRSVTVRKLAAVVRLSPSALIAHFDTKERIVTLIAHRVGAWLVWSIETGVETRGSDGVLPDVDTVRLVRAWLGLAEMARAGGVLGLAFRTAEERLQDQVCDAFDLDGADVVTGQTIYALVIGLWTGMCARSEPMPYEHARTILRHLCARIGVPLRVGRSG